MSRYFSEMVKSKALVKIFKTNNGIVKCSICSCKFDTYKTEV